MKTSSSAFLILLLAVLVCAETLTAASLVQVEQTKPVQNTDTGEGYDTIGQAINAPETQDNHTIRVSAGVYFEHVVVNKSISLIGENPETTVLDGNGTGITILEITVVNVAVMNFTIRDTGGSGYGIHMFRSNSSMIGNNVIDSCHMGIILFQSHKNVVWNNTIRGSSTAILLDYSPNNQLLSNYVSESGDGLRIEAMSVNNTASMNCIESCSYGVGLSVFSNGNLLFENSISLNSLSALRFDRSSNCTFIDNVFSRNSHVVEAASPLSDNNTFLRNDFILNTAIISFLEPYDVWDDGYPGGGNYWSDYTGKDERGGPFQNETGSDGIGDTPYCIGSKNVDNYPLFGPFSEFSATQQDSVSVVSNSTLSNFQFNGTAIRFNVSGVSDTSGFCRVCVPTTLINATYRVLVNGNDVSHSLLWGSNSTHSYIYFTYTHSTYEVMIVPEFPSLLVVLLFSLATLPSVTLVLNRKWRLGS